MLRELKSKFPPGMLNWAARYFAILRALKPHLSEKDSLLEIGSGWVGIGRFRPRPFVGCDTSFLEQPRAPMLPVLASATELPFGDRSFDAVVLSDVLEHIPPDQRMPVIREALRIGRKVAVFGFPSGQPAFERDLYLAKAYDRRRQNRPEWLEEHLRYQPYPTESLFANVQGGWIVASFGNESAAFHNWVMLREMQWRNAELFRVLLTIAPRMVEFLLQFADREPYYRKIMVLHRPHA